MEKKVQRKIYHIKLIYGKEVNFTEGGKLKNETSISKLDEQEYQAVKTSYPGLGACRAECIDIKGIPAKEVKQAIEDVNVELAKHNTGVKTIKPPVKIVKAPEKVSMYIDGEVNEYDLKGLLKLAEKKGIGEKLLPAGQLKDVAKFIIEWVNVGGNREGDVIPEKKEPVKPTPTYPKGTPGRKPASGK